MQVFHLFDHRIARSGGWMVAFRATFSSRSGVFGQWNQLHEISKSAALNLPRGQAFVFCLCSRRIPGGLRRFDLVPREQLLPVRQGAQPHPPVGTHRIGGLIGVQAQVLWTSTRKNDMEEKARYHSRRS